MKPLTPIETPEIINSQWVSTTDMSGNLNDRQIAMHAALDTARTMRRIEKLLLNLGTDGIHSLIRISANEAIRRDNERLRKARAKRRRARAAKLKAA